MDSCLLRDVTARRLLEFDRMYAHGAGGGGDSEDGRMVETQMSVPGVSDLADGIV